jgi:hypothetical protein
MPLYHSSFFFGLQKDSGMATYYYLDVTDYKLLGGMHIGHDINSYFETNRIYSLPKTELFKDNGMSILDITFFLYECKDLYDPDEYYIVDGVHLFKSV